MVHGRGRFGEHDRLGRRVGQQPGERKGLGIDLRASAVEQQAHMIGVVRTGARFPVRVEQQWKKGELQVGPIGHRKQTSEHPW